MEKDQLAGELIGRSSIELQRDEPEHVGAGADAYRLVVNGTLREIFPTFETALLAVSAMRSAGSAPPVDYARISIESAECEEIYAIVIGDDGSPDLGRRPSNDRQFRTAS